MDEVARYNRARWRALAQAGAVFTRPVWDLDPPAAQRLVDPEGRLGALAGRRVLCLAGGGGQQAPAFALLGAQVTVVDLSADQLQRDQAVAAHYGLSLTTIEGDMRDLAMLAGAGFDLVWHPYSLNFVPDARAVFREVARVLRPGGQYYVMCANPFAGGLGTHAWNGTGYTLQDPYIDGAVTTYPDEEWVYDHSAAPAVPPPREYRHTLSTLVNGLADHGFVLRHLAEHTEPSGPGAAPGTWDHFTTVAPPWLSFWTRYRPDPPASP
jgi:ubiquinone/menaquinone biosynthesis C-methylase UbiE